MNYLLNFISAAVLEEEIKHTNIQHSGCFKSSGIKVDFMIVSDKKHIKIFSVLHGILGKIKNTLGQKYKKKLTILARKQAAVLRQLKKCISQGVIESISENTFKIDKHDK